MCKSWRIQNSKTHQSLQDLINSAAIDLDDATRGERSCFRQDVISLADFLDGLLENFNKLERYEMDYDPDKLQLLQSVCAVFFKQEMEAKVDLATLFSQEILGPMKTITMENMPEPVVAKKLRCFCVTMQRILIAYLRPHVLCKRRSVST